MGNSGERRRGQHPLAVEDGSDRHAGGDKAGDQPVPGLGRDGLADGLLELGATPAAFLEAKAASAPRASSWHRLDQKCCSLTTPRATCPPSAVVKSPYPGVGVDAASVRGPSAAPAGPVQVDSTSVMETSRYAPSPLVARPSTAAQIPNAAVSPAARSAVGSGGMVVALPPSGVSDPDQA